MKSILGEPFDALRAKSFKQKRISNATEEKANRRNLWKESLKSVFIFTVIVFLLWLLLSFVISPYTLKSNFMGQDFPKGKRVWLLREGLFQHAYRNQDLVLVELSPDLDLSLFSQSQGLSKVEMLYRVVAQPFDVVELKEDRVYVNGNLLEEAYLKGALTHMDKLKYQRVVLGENDYFVLGDDRENALDSRFFGPITREEILGKIFP